MIQGFLGFGKFVGGTVRLAIPAIILGFLLGIFIGLGRLAPSRWIRIPATIYVEFFRGVPLVMVIFWIWIVVPIVLSRPIPEFWVALSAFVIFEAAYLGEIVRAGVQSVARGQVEAAHRRRAHGHADHAPRRPAPGPEEHDPLAGDAVHRALQGHVARVHHRLHGSDQGGPGRQRREVRPFALYLFIAVVYWVCTYSMSRYARHVEQRLSPA